MLNLTLRGVILILYIRFLPVHLRLAGHIEDFWQKSNSENFKLILHSKIDQILEQ